MTYEELREYYHENGCPTGYQLNAAEHREFKKAVKEAASFVDDIKGEKKFALYLWCVLNDVTSPPPCKECGEPVNGVRKSKFNDYCSTKCSSIGSNSARIKTFEKNGGHPMHRKEVVKTVSDALKTGEKSIEYRKRKREEFEEYYDAYGKKFNKPRIDAYGNEYYNEFEWFGGFHPNTLSNGGKASIVWLRKALESKGKTKEQIAKRWERDVYLHEYRKGTRGTHHNQKHIPSDVNEILGDKSLLEEMYEECHSVKELAEILGVADTTVNRALQKFEIEIKQGHRVSNAEIQIRKFLIEECGLKESDLLYNDRKTYGVEADIIIPSKKICIEHNGIRYHSYPNKPRMHHQTKSLLAAEIGFKMIHVWEDDWKDPVKKEIIKARIKFNVGIYEKIHARECTIDMDVSNGDLRKFFNENHIQGYVGSSSHVALMHNGEIVACIMTKRARKEDGVFELTRYATKCGYQVMGGFTRCLKNFQRNNEWKEIFTYASLDYSNGNSYDVAGFVKQGITVPGMFYTKQGKRYNRRKFMKHKLKDKLENFDSTLTERENMYNHGFSQLFDSGSIKYVMKND